LGYFNFTQVKTTKANMKFKHKKSGEQITAFFPRSEDSSKKIYINIEMYLYATDILVKAHTTTSLFATFNINVFSINFMLFIFFYNHSLSVFVWLFRQPIMYIASAMPKTRNLR